jgi:hypothetical protein
MMPHKAFSLGKDLIVPIEREETSVSEFSRKNSSLYGILRKKPRARANEPFSATYILVVVVVHEGMEGEVMLLRQERVCRGPRKESHGSYVD